MRTKPKVFDKSRGQFTFSSTENKGEEGVVARYKIVSSFLKNIFIFLLKKLSFINDSIK